MLHVVQRFVISSKGKYNFSTCLLYLRFMAESQYWWKCPVTGPEQGHAPNRGIHHGSYFLCGWSFFTSHLLVPNDDGSQTEKLQRLGHKTRDCCPRVVSWTTKEGADNRSSSVASHLTYIMLEWLDPVLKFIDIHHWQILWMFPDLISFKLGIIPPCLTHSDSVRTWFLPRLLIQRIGMSLQMHA